MRAIKKVFKSISTLYKEHSSFVIIVIGSLITFLSNILFEKYFGITEYGEYSIFITYLLFVYSFGFLGLEQVLVRITEVSSASKLIISKFLFTLLILVGVLFSAVSTFIFNNYFFETNASFIEICTITLAVLYSQLFYNLYRLKSKFVMSQVFATSWKLPLLILIVTFFILQRGTFEIVFDLFFYVSILLMIFYVFKLFTLFSFTNQSNKQKIYGFWIYFMLSIGSINLITFFDRFYIKLEFGNEALGEYFYLANFFLFPFGLFQNYIGFKQLILFKEQYNWSFFLTKLKKGLLASLLLGVAIVIVCYLLTTLDLIQIQFEERYTLILLFLFLGIIKVCYGLASSAVGARISIDSFKRINVMTIVVTFVLYGMFYSLFKLSVEIVLLFISVLWGIRLLIYLYYLKKE